MRDGDEALIEVGLPREGTVSSLLPVCSNCHVMEHFLHQLEKVRGCQQAGTRRCLEEDRTMAEQRTTRGSETSPARESSRQEGDKAQAVGTQVRDTAQQVSRTASEYYAQGREQLEDVSQSLEEHIRDKPLQSVLMAAGLGMLLALLWKH